MNADGRRSRGALLATLPTLTLLVGVALVGAASETGIFPTGDLLVLLVAAAVAPLAAVGCLRIVAPDHDQVIVAIIGMLAATGVTTLYLLAVASAPINGFYATIVMRHAGFVALGFVAMSVGAFGARKIDLARRYPYSMLLLALLLTGATIAFGQTVNGATLWLDIGWTRFQPSEIARILIALFIATYLYDRRHLVTAPWNVGGIDLPPAPYLMPLVVAVATAGALLALQNDLGMAALVTLGASASVMGSLRSRGGIGVVGLVLAGGIGAAFLTEARVRDRFFGWLDPWLDPAGRGFQFVQAEYSLASGGVFGPGPVDAAGNIPEVHTDFILVGIGSQSGLLLSTAVLILMMLLICRCVMAALMAPDEFKGLVALSVTALIAIQVLLIVGGSLRVLPLTGLTLPLVSYGGTSMVATLFALGLVLGIGAEGNRCSALARLSVRGEVRLS